MATKQIGAADILAQALKEARRKGPPCTAGVFLASLSDVDRDVFQQAVALSFLDYPHTALEEAAWAMGARVGASTWGRHRAHRCLCFRDHADG